MKKHQDMVVSSECGVLYSCPIVNQQTRRKTYYRATVPPNKKTTTLKGGAPEPSQCTKFSCRRSVVFVFVRFLFVVFSC